MSDNLKPKCNLVGEDGNIFFILGRKQHLIMKVFELTEALMDKTFAED